MAEGSGTDAAQAAEEEPRRGRPRSEAAHRAVLATTARLMETTPYSEITVERIAAEAGVGKQTIYRWWSSKAAVALEVVLSGHVSTDLAELPDTGDLRADLLAWMDATVEEAFTPEVLSLARALLTALAERGERTEALLQDHRVWDEGGLADRVRAEQAAGRVRDDIDPRAVSAALLDPLLLRMITTGRPDAAWARSLVITVLEGLRLQD